MTTGKRRTWLWVLGWIFCFPIPLTILLLRNEKMGKPLRYALVALLWILVIFIGSNNGNQVSVETASQNEQAAQTQTTKDGQKNEEAEASKEEEGNAPAKEAVKESEESEAASKVSDDTLKAFIQSYEQITGTELGKIEKKGTQGYRATTAGHVLELTYATIQIDNNDDFEDMRQIFHDAANALDPSLGDRAYAIFDEGMEKMSNEEDGVIEEEAFKANFSAPNEPEKGSIQLIVNK